MPAIEVRIQRTEFGTELYRSALQLRDRVLLSPTGRRPSDFAAANPGAEERSAHFVALGTAGEPTDRPIGRPTGGPTGEVIGCVLIRPNHPRAGTGKLLQMATREDLQGRGVGRKLVRAAEAWSTQDAGLTSLHCHAREVAVPFYQQLGWVVVGDRFDEIGIPHFRMERALPGEDRKIP